LLQRVIALVRVERVGWPLPHPFIATVVAHPAPWRYLELVFITSDGGEPVLGRKSAPGAVLGPRWCSADSALEGLQVS
jgi:hypothetical protein